MVLRNNFIVVILGGCLYLTAQARVPQAKLPTLPVLQAHYQSLYQVLSKQAVWNRAGEEYLDLMPLQEFLQGKPLNPEEYKELEEFSAEYEDILKTKDNEVSIVDLLEYSNLQEKAEAKAQQADDEAYIRLVDASIKSLPSKNKLYLFTIELTLENGEKVTLIKPGKSSEGGTKARIDIQINLLNGVAENLAGVTFTLPQFEEPLKVTAMEVKQVNLAGTKKYLDLNYGVTDGDVHRLLSALGYQMVHGIPNIQGGEKREVFIRIEDGKYKDSNYVEEVVEAWKKVQGEKTYYERIQNNIPIPSNTGISLNLGEYKTQLIFEQMKLSASEFKDDKAKLASMLFDIKLYKKNTGNGKKVRELYLKYVEENGYDAETQAAAERLSQEVFLLSSIISTIQQQEGGGVAQVAKRLGLGRGYSYTKHLKNGLASKEKDVLQNLTTLGVVLHAQYAKLTDVYGKLLELYPEVNTAFGRLQTSIAKAGGWQALHTAMQKNPISAGQFRNQLANAALRGEDIERITEVILIYRIISTIQQEEGGEVYQVAKRLGLGNYSYKKHLKKGLSSFISESDKKKNAKEQKNIVLRNLTTLGIVLHTQHASIAIKYASDDDPDNLIEIKLTDVYEDLVELHPNVSTAFGILQTSIAKAGGWQALHTAMNAAIETAKQNDRSTRGGAASAGQFRNELAKAALRGEDIERITEVILISRIISTIQQKEGRKVSDVASRLGLGMRYSYEGHLKNGISSFISESDKKKNDNEQKNIVLRNFTTLGAVIHTQHVKLTDVYGKLLELYPEVNTAFDLLKASIKAAGGWKALQAAMHAAIDTAKQNDRSTTGAAMAAGQFRNELAAAALHGTEEGRITEVILIYSIISTIQQEEGGSVQKVARRLGLGGGYNYKEHLKKGWEFDLGKLQKKLDEELAKWKDQYSKENYKLLQNIINECMPRLHKLHAPQYKLPQLEQAEQMELPFAG